MTEKIKITFLGTSDSVPSAERNHTGILLSYGFENILIDCGEGTQRQFRKAKLNPCKLTKILITHWDLDHILGIPGLISTLGFSGYNRELEIYGPKGTKKYIEMILRFFHLKNKIKLKVIEVAKGIFFENKDFCLCAEKMVHGVSCNAYCFCEKTKLKIDKKKLKKFKIAEGKHLQNLKQGKDIVYCGKKIKAKDLIYSGEAKKICFVLDTRFNSRIKNFVKDSDLLISESEFSKEIKDIAYKHKHLTAEQVGKIAKSAKVKKLILTHVSQRYSKDFNVILREAKKIFKNTILAKDLMGVEI